MPLRIPQREVREAALRHFEGRLPGARRWISVFDHAGIETRSFCVPLEWFETGHGFGEKNACFIEAATEFSARAVREVLAAHDVDPRRIDHVLFVTSTGLATPTIDARLANLLGFAPSVRRYPLWGLGCAGGSLGLVHAASLLAGRPRDLALLVNVELCSLTFLSRDCSKSNLVAAALFSDGVTAALLGGAECGLDGVEILATHTHLWPDSLDVMGWSFEDEGMQVVFSKRIPELVERHARGHLAATAARAGIALDAIDHFLVHPGGAKVLAAYERALGSSALRLDLPARILRDHGNCSSATVMLVVEEFLRRKGARSGEHALVTALGPGFNAASLVLRG